VWRNVIVNDSWADAYLSRIGAKRPARAEVLAAYRTWFGVELDRVP
jgi:hypothetical protein